MLFLSVAWKPERDGLVRLVLGGPFLPVLGLEQGVFIEEHFCHNEMNDSSLMQS